MSSRIRTKTTKTKIIKRKKYMIKDLKHIEKYGALLHSKWEQNTLSQHFIHGTWAEDGSKYDITCPNQLAPLLVKLQNLLSDLYNEWLNKNSEVTKMDTFLIKLFGDKNEI